MPLQKNVRQDFEIRSDDSESLEKLQEYFDTLLEKTRQEGAGELEVKKDILGIRPSMGGFSEEGMVQQIGLVERIKPDNTGNNRKSTGCKKRFYGL